MIYRLRSMVTAVALFTALAVLLLWGLSLQLQRQLRDQVLERAQLRSQQLADAMAACLDSPVDILARMGESARARVRARHDVDAAAATLAGLFGGVDLRVG